MRPSTTRASHAPGSLPQQQQQPPSATLLARLADKKKEFEAVDALGRAAALFRRRLDGLADDCEAMAEAGIVHGQVLAQWPQMFHILNMFAAARESSSVAATDGAWVDTDAAVPPGGRLVRVPIDELQLADIK
ncbi:hypothetical protein DFH94DRAFT_690666 [Russula ochroleuca]|jgi:DASH complex subunit DAD2|uniref:Outer kinetochore protein DAD2 n=1 Tax=Russula ochroleuca TaxID=152965 RepID=A0A9P5TB53_9AGAM|nr:hypothetical protein DFH94DRAFT_690666 [Russula ochroleuca]